jgi:hypothetical protein
MRVYQVQILQLLSFSHKAVIKVDDSSISTVSFKLGGNEKSVSREIILKYNNVEN